MLFFLCIMFIILLGYGITAHVILYPHVKQPATVFESILYRPYFQIYGELFLEDITGRKPCKTILLYVSMKHITDSYLQPFNLLFSNYRNPHDIIDDGISNILRH